MTALFHIPTIDRRAGHDAGMRALMAFAGAYARMVNDPQIAPVGRRAR